MKNLSGTKEAIFDTFVKMTSDLGYENVTIRDIAENVGLKGASLYNHFESKGKMLECAYQYYAERQYDTRTSVDRMRKLIETARAEEIIAALSYTFETEDQKKYIRMILITKIIYMRLYQDPVANAIFAETHENNAEYVRSVLQHGINIGRLDPEFDIMTFADVLIGSKTIMGIRSFAGVDYVVGQLAEEGNILTLLARLLSVALIDTTDYK